jgi:HD-like signal output (HDOD) protein
MTADPSRPEPSVDNVLERTLKDIGIPTRPVILDRIAEEMRKDDPNTNHLSHLISADVSLSASLIKMVNSPYFGLRGRARSINEALLMLGMNVTCRAIAGLSLRKAFPTSPRLERFWNSSAQIAVLSGWLAEEIDNPKLHAEEAYTYGLFRDCGIPVMLQRFPAYENTLTLANDEPLAPFTQVELDAFPTDHAMVGCLLAQNWWLPEEVCLAIRHHHEAKTIDMHDSGMPALSRQIIATGQVAEYILQQTGGLSRTMEWPKLGESCMRLLDLTQDDLSALCVQAREVLKTVE